MILFLNLMTLGCPIGIKKTIKLCEGLLRWTCLPTGRFVMDNGKLKFREALKFTAPTFYLYSGDSHVASQLTNPFMLLAMTSSSLFLLHLVDNAFGNSGEGKSAVVKKILHSDHTGKIAE